MSYSRKKKKKKRIMRTLKIEEISGVDFPAQEGASALIMKRAEDEEESLLDNSVEEEPESPLEKTSGGHETHSEESEMTQDTETTAIDSEAVLKRIESLEESLKTSQSYGEMTDMQKSHYSGLDEEARGNFLELDTEGREAEVAKSQSDDPVVYTDFEGNDFFKSDDPRTISAVKRADVAIKVAQAAEERAQTLELTKRATDTLEHLPGDLDMKVAVLKALDGIEDEDHRTKALEMLKSNGDKLAEAFLEKGTSEGHVRETHEQLESMAKKFAEDHDIDIVQARVKVLETEAGTALYQQTI